MSHFKIDTVRQLAYTERELEKARDRVKELETINHQQRVDRAQILSINEVLREQVEDSERDIRELKARLSSQELDAMLTLDKFKIQFNPC